MAVNKSKVKLVGNKHKVIFSVTPSSLSESRTANYDQWNLVHLPTDLYAYRNTTSRTWDIQVQLVSRNKQEAAVNSKNLNIVRSWLLPDFAQSGAPPDILKFYAYDDPNINSVTCILRNYSWTYPTDVDYVIDEKNPSLHKMPVIGTLGISLIEIYSATEIQKRVWDIKIGDEKKSDGPLGKTPLDIIPGGADDLLDEASDLLNDVEEQVDNLGDPINLLNNISIPSVNEIVKDAVSNLPSIPIPSIPNGLANGIPPFSIPGFSNPFA